MDILKDLTNFSLFLELHFLLLSLSTIVLCIWFVVPYFYLADHMEKCGYTEADASYVLSVIGITNTLGMVSLTSCKRYYYGICKLKVCVRLS